MFVKIEKPQDSVFHDLTFKNLTNGQIHVVLHALEAYAYAPGTTDEMVVQLRSAMSQADMFPQSVLAKH